MERQGQIYVTISLGGGKEALGLRNEFYSRAESEDVSFSKWAVRAMKKELEEKK